MSKTFTTQEVARHNTSTDMWIIIDGDVYDLSKFARMHPGGEMVLTPYAGKDATEAFYDMHRIEVLKKYQRLKIGRVAGAKGVPPVQTELVPGKVSQVPYAEPSFWQGFKSAYFDQSHTDLRDAVRTYIDTELVPVADMYERSGKYPPLSMWQSMGKNGILGCRIGPGPWMNKLSQWGITLPGGVQPEKFDYFHELIVHLEMARMCAPGFVDALGAGYVIGLPPVLHFAQPAVRDRVAQEVFTGNKRICLAISEPFAGSDVAAIKCTAKKSACGKYYIVNGVKKWITNGTFCEYFVTAVRTGGPGMKGISMLLVPRLEGLETSQITTTYSKCAGTAYVTYDNVKVPVEYLLGQENQGFKIIMYNFNHERWMIIAAVVGGTRRAIEECFLWANQRKVFGKKLIEQPVIRNKLANMVSRLEAVYNWLENLTYQMCQMTYNEQAKKLAGPIALCKLLSTRTALAVADDAAQIFGGRAITQSGMGKKVEGFARAVKFAAIYGGSEEIMADLGIKMAGKQMPARARL